MDITYMIQTAKTQKLRISKIIIKLIIKAMSNYSYTCVHKSTQSIMQVNLKKVLQLT